jgi:peptidyl-prolyl cis-trans isomerase C
MKLVTSAIILLTLAVGAAAQQPLPAKQTTATAAPSGKIIARVNGVALTDRDLLRQMEIDFPYAKQHGGRVPPQLEKDIKRSALSTIEFEELLYQEAQRRKLTVPPAKLAAAERDFKKQFPTTSDFKNYLYAEHQGSIEILRAKIKRAILIDQLLQSEVTRKSTMTDAQLLDFYKKNPDKFRKPESASIQTISVLIPDNATPAQKQQLRQRADSLAKQAKATKNYEEFGVLAEKNSDDDWRVMMGDHKSVHRGRMPPAVEKAVFSMQAGQVSDVLEAENSYCIVRVNAREQTKLVSFQEIKPQMKKDLESMRNSQVKQQFEASLRKGAKVEEF